MQTLRVVRLCVFLVSALLSQSLAQKQSAATDKVVARGKYLVDLGGCSDCHTPKKLGPHGPVLDESRLLSGSPATDPVLPIPAEALGMGPDKWAAVTNMHLSTWADQNISAFGDRQE